MVETSKQVRVDNWGIFFLSRLQVFFNKTDYCDLTLQFDGNVQLKVHRLVMNACTEYFQVLEETCDVVDDVLMMPPELQADVILPIVNFMYTGMLEFQMSIFERLYKTAEIMNITVLLQLLDAQKQSPSPVTKPVSKLVYNMKKGGSGKLDKSLPATLPGRKLPVWKRKNAPSPATMLSPTSSFSSEPRKKLISDPLGSFDNTPKPTRFEWPEDELKHFPLLDSSFDNISYTSKPLLTQEEELRASTSFDNVRYLPNSNKRTQEYNSSNIDMDDLKSYVKEQKIRSDMVDDEYDDIDKDIEIDASDLDYTVNTSVKRKNSSHQLLSGKKVRFSLSEKENKDTKINVSTSSVKSEVDHSKIISEVLKKYPHLVKKNKNIRLKILGKNKSPEAKLQTIKTTSKLKLQFRSPKISSIKEVKSPVTDEGPWICNKCLIAGEEVEFVLYYLYRKHMTDVHNEKFDSRMCKYCGHKSSKHNMLMYHQYTKHGIKPPPAYNFPRCNQCPYVALTENLMIKHKLNHTNFDLQCTECKVGFNSEISLKHHIQITGHTGKSGRTNYDCQYCTKHYQTGANLFSHIRLIHRDEARRDGIVSIDEEDEDDGYDDDSDPPQTIDKIKILSNVSLQSEDHQSLPPPTTTRGETLATSLGLVDIVVLDENQQYILHPNPQETLTNNQEFILPELPQSYVPNPTMIGNSDIASTDELVMVLTDHDYNDGSNEILTQDNSNIVVLYSHPVEGQTGQFITSQGNIMLNSETGMLELRNGSMQTPTGTVESIELIQREIDSHTSSEMKREEDVPNSGEGIISDPDSGTVFQSEEEITEPDAGTPFANEGVLAAENQVENVTYVVEEEDKAEGDPVEEDKMQEPEAMEVEDEMPFDEALVDNHQETSIPSEERAVPSIEVHEVIDRTENHSEDPVLDSLETETEMQVDEIETVSDQIHPSIDDEPVKENEDVVKAEIETNLKESIVKPIEEETSTEMVSQIDAQHPLPEENNVYTPEQVYEETPEDLHVEALEQINVEEPQKELIAEVCEHKEIEKESSVDKDDPEAKDECMIKGAEALDEHVPEPMEVDGGNHAPEVPEEADKTEEINEIREVCPEPEQIEEIVVKEVKEDGILKTGEDESEEISVDETDTIEPEESTPLVLNETENDEVSSKVDERDESNSTAEDVSASADETIVNKTDSQEEDDTQKSEETSTDSADRMKTAKSLLDDWEDTDSQQSEHGKSVNTVNKLINDWDDD